MDLVVSAQRGPHSASILLHRTTEPGWRGSIAMQMRREYLCLQHAAWFRWKHCVHASKKNGHRAAPACKITGSKHEYV
jgi:hypothetical protein